jgi:membrane protein
MKIKDRIDRVFTLRLKEVKNPWMRRLIRFVRLMGYMLRSLLNHGTMLRSDALTYYTLISIVPIVALAFAIVNGFGMMSKLVGNLYALLPTMPDLVDLIVDFAERALERTQGGIVAVVSIATLFWSVISMFNSIESAFNNIWEVKQGRNIMRRISNYITIFVMAPLLWVLSSYLGSFINEVIPLSQHWVLILCGKLVSIFIAGALFSFLFIILPNTKVHIRPACVAGLVTAIFFVAFQWLYVWIQSMMTSYNAIYGSFAALPLFLVWVKVSWQIFLLGGELSFAVQNMQVFDEEHATRHVSYTSRRAVMLAIMYEICNAFRSGRGGLNTIELNHRLNLPPHLMHRMLLTLCEAGLLHEIEGYDDREEKFFAPARDISTLRIYDILEAVDDAGYGKQTINEESTERWSEAIEKIRCAARLADDNKLLIDLKPDNYD